MNGGCLGRYGSYSSAQISAALPYLYGKRAANSNSDIVNAKLVVMFGENSVETKAGGAGPTYHLEQALEQGGAKVIVIDPRYSDTVATRADQWIPIRPGTDAALVDAVAHTLIEEDLVDHDFLATYCIGYDEDTMPESAQGQNKSYKAYIMGQGVDGVEKTPAWAEGIHGDSRRYHCRAGTRDRHCETLRHLPRQGSAAPIEWRADGTRHLHAAGSHGQRRHQRRQHGFRP